MWKWLYATVTGEINIFINCILKFINVEVALRPGSRRINHLLIKYIIEHIQVEETLCRCNKKCQKPQNIRNFEDLYLLNCQANYLYGRQAGSARAVI
jgi:hypothetical protein